MSRSTTKKKPDADTYDDAADSTGSYYAAIEAKRKRGDATRQDSPPLDYVDTPEDDEPYNRCPICSAAIAGVVGGIVLAALMAAAFAIKEMMTWVM